jgi:hypothetical protein
MTSDDSPDTAHRRFDHWKRGNKWATPDPTSTDQNCKAHMEAAIKEWSVTLFPVVVIVGVC